MSTVVTQTEFPYVGNGSQVDWPFIFSVTSTDDIGVYLALDGEIISTLLNPSLYEITYDAQTLSGSVKYPLVGDPITSLDKIAVKRNTINKQGFNYRNQAKIKGETLENSDDNLSRVSQDLANELKRALIVDVTSTETPLDILIAINEGVKTTNENVALTNADVVTTNNNVILTGNDVITTGNNVIATNADVVLTGNDVISTNADVVLTGLDVVATNADVVLANQAVVDATAQAVIAREGWQGLWLIGTTYAENEKVEYLGSSYISLQDGNTGNTPDIGGTAFWDLTGLKGDKGDTGATGATGATGEKGDKGDTGATGSGGSPTMIDGGVVSNVLNQYTPVNGATYNSVDNSYSLNGTNQHLTFPLNEKSLASADFDFYTEIEMDVIASNGILGQDTNETSIMIETQATQMALSLSSNGTTWDIGVSLGSKNDWATGTKYQLHAYNTGTEWRLDWSDDGKAWDDGTKTWTNDVTIASSAQLFTPTNDKLLLGGEFYNTDTFLDGKVFLSNTALIVDGEAILTAQQNKSSITNISSVVARSYANTKDFNLGASLLSVITGSDWKSGSSQPFVNDIPAMTSNVLPAGYVASASSTVNVSFEAWQAFDGSKTNEGWSSNAATAWLKLKIPVAKAYISYAVTSRNTVGEEDTVPKNWTLEGSNDNSNWDVLDTRSNESLWSPKETRYYNFNNSTDYLYYRINVSSNNGDPQYIQIGELEFSESSARLGNTINVFIDDNSGNPRTIFDTSSSFDELDRPIPDNITGEYRFIGSFITDNDGEIVPFNSYGNGNEIKRVYNDEDGITNFSNSVSVGASTQNISLSTPPNVEATVNVRSGGDSNTVNAQTNIVRLDSQIILDTLTQAQYPSYDSNVSSVEITDPSSVEMYTNLSFNESNNVEIKTLSYKQRR